MHLIPSEPEHQAAVRLFNEMKGYRLFMSDGVMFEVLAHISKWDPYTLIKHRLGVDSLIMTADLEVEMRAVPPQLDREPGLPNRANLRPCNDWLSVAHVNHIQVRVQSLNPTAMVNHDVVAIAIRLEPLV